MRLSRGHRKQRNPLFLRVKTGFILPLILVFTGFLLDRAIEATAFGNRVSWKSSYLLLFLIAVPNPLDGMRKKLGLGVADSVT